MWIAKLRAPKMAWSIWVVSCTPHLVARQYSDVCQSRPREFLSRLNVSPLVAKLKDFGRDLQPHSPCLDCGIASFRRRSSLPRSQFMLFLFYPNFGQTHRYKAAFQSTEKTELGSIWPHFQPKSLRLKEGVIGSNPVEAAILLNLKCTFSTQSGSNLALS